MNASFGALVRHGSPGVAESTALVSGSPFVGAGNGVGGALVAVGLALAGVLGLAAGREPDERLSELIERVERLVDGDADVTFPTDRDDDLGRLAAALEDLAGQLREHDEGPGERRRQLEAIAANTESPIYIKDRDGVYQFVNEAAARLFDRSRSGIVGQTDADLLPPEVLEDVEASDRRVLERDEPVSMETPVVVDGQRRVFLDNKFPYRGEDGTVQGVLGIAHDITERKERERELSTLMANIPGMVYRARNEPDWPFEFVSEGAREVTGYDPETLESGDVNWGQEVVDDDGLRETVQAALDRREPYRVTYRIVDADGDHRWVWEQGRGVFDGDDLVALEGVILDVTERRRREAELERTRDFLERTQRIASVGGWELDLRGDPPYDGEFTDELYRIYGLPVGSDVDMERGLEFYHPDHRDRVREAVERAIETGEPYELEAVLVTADGEKRWVRTTGVPIYEDGELVTLRGALQDITEQKERELALESLQELSHELLGTETAPAVAELVVDRAAEFLAEPCIAVYLLDDDTNDLVPAAVSDGFADLCEEPGPVPVDRADSILWDVFVNGERAVVDAGESPLLGPAIQRGVVYPLDDYGVFLVATPGPETCDRAWQLVGTLVATTEAALERIESETLLRERETELAERNRRLRRQMQITDIIRSVHSSLIGAESRADIEQAVCEHLVEAEHVRFAWIGALDAAGETVVRAWEGAGQDYLDDLPLGAEDSEPSAVTARSGETTVVENVVEGLGTADWCQEALLREFHSVVSVPLAFDEFSAGVLTVYADEPDAFGDLEGAVFTELGESIANAIVAVNARTALHTETLVELTVRLSGDSFFARVAREADCQVTYEGLAAGDGDESRVFFTTTGAAGETVVAVLEELVSVTDARLVSAFDGEYLFEVTVAEETLPARLARHGGRLRSLRVDETLELVVDVPPTTDVRAFLDTLADEYDAVELVGRRDVERSIQTRQEFLEYLLDELTDRQLEVLRTAYHAGFFEWPRASTGEDIAEMLGVTQPTVNRHLRLGQQRLLEALFEHAAVDGG